MRKFLLSIFALFSTLAVSAAHITGGEVRYEFLRDEGDSKVYRITLLLFRDNNCQGCAGLPVSVPVGIYNNDNSSLFGGFRTVDRTTETEVPILAFPGCLTNAPSFNYSMGTYPMEVTLPNNNAGYTFSYQTCCRVKNIVNLTSNPSTGGDQGSTYIAVIPGKNKLIGGINDNSAQFQTGISVICYGRRFTLDFSATDSDGDEIVYELCNGLDGGAAVDAGYSTPAGPPHNSLSYQSPYSGLQPLGSLATINSSTGIISGIAPSVAGAYVVSVCAKSYRNGLFLDEHRKDFIVTVSPCDLSGAELDLSYSNCKDSTFTFTNNNNSPLNLTFLWTFGDGNTSTEQMPTHTYADTGVYKITLTVNAGGSCSSTAESLLSVFPSFETRFATTAPACKNVNVQFTDQTFATYGPVNKWRWNFGDPSSGVSNTSVLKDPVHAYNTSGTYNVQLISSSPKGCIDTLLAPVIIVDTPALRLPNDTLICSVDTLQISAQKDIPGGTIRWSPNYMISDVNSFTPLVSPDVTTTYTAVLTDPSGCSAIKSFTIRVVDFVTVAAMPDTTICRTDSIQLRIVTDGLLYRWTPTAGLSNPNILNPRAAPNASSTTYTLTSTIGKCSKTADIIVRTVPYPAANAGPDSAICAGTSMQLNATGGSTYAWTPTSFLSATNIPNPIVRNPNFSVQYIVTVRDTLGCPKPVRDTVYIKVIKLVADAGPRDTSIVKDQPLQLNGTGGDIYLWSPGTYLSDVNISNPVSNPKDSIEYVLRVSNAEGCTATDTINVRLFFLEPGLYVPTAFTPNGDAINNTFKPIALGIRSLDNFVIYNRFGELVFQTSQIGKGWDGKYKAAAQGTDTFVWYAEATDYKGRKLKKKGTVVLIR